MQIWPTLSGKDLRRCGKNHLLTEYLLFSNWTHNESPQMYLLSSHRNQYGRFFKTTNSHK